MSLIASIILPTNTEYYSHNLTKYNYIFTIEGYNYIFNILSTNDHDAYESLKDFFETFMDFAREWIDLNNKYHDIIEKFHYMSKYTQVENNKILSLNLELQNLDNEIYETFDILINLLNMYTNIDYYLNNSSNMIYIINLIQNIKSMIVYDLMQISNTLEE